MGEDLEKETNERTITEQRLLELLRKRAYKKGVFELASGEISDYYIDAREVVVNSLGAFLVGEALYHRIEKYQIHAIGGLETGAIPLVTAAVISSNFRNKTIEGFWVRNRSKDHGTGRTIEGSLRYGSNVIITDDVVTKGLSILKAMRAVKDIGCTVLAVIPIVDRLAGAESLLRENGVTNYQPIFTINDLRR
jgi:orotate phosphoribosyltransferase